MSATVTDAPSAPAPVSADERPLEGRAERGALWVVESAMRCPVG